MSIWVILIEMIVFAAIFTVIMFWRSVQGPADIPLRSRGKDFNELAGSPWIDSLLTGNLPEEAP